MSEQSTVPETKVLAIASHVVYGYVGNKMACFVLEVMGCDVAGISTVNFSNHTGYKRFTGTSTTAAQITSLYSGLKSSFLTDFDVLLSGYIPSAEAVEAVATIARDLKFRRQMTPGGFFWVLDPVMGDQGRLYVKSEVAEAYKSVVGRGECDLVLPNQFEAEVLTGRESNSLKTLKDVVGVVTDLHGMGVNHVVLTSVRLEGEEFKDLLIVVGSTRKSDGGARVWKIVVPVLQGYFSGTGDMFAALMVARLREETVKADVAGVKGWISPDDVPATETPLARAAGKVLGSLQMILEKTVKAKEEQMRKFTAVGGDDGTDGQEGGKEGGGLRGEVEGDQSGSGEARRWLAECKAGEVRVVRNWRDLVVPEERYSAEAVEVEVEGKE